MQVPHQRALLTGTSVLDAKSLLDPYNFASIRGEMMILVISRLQLRSVFCIHFKTKASNVDDSGLEFQNRCDTFRPYYSPNVNSNAGHVFLASYKAPSYEPGCLSYFNWNQKSIWSLLLWQHLSLCLYLTNAIHLSDCHNRTDRLGDISACLFPIAGKPINVLLCLMPTLPGWMWGQGFHKNANTRWIDL